MSKALIALAVVLTFSLAVQAGTIYRTTDARGNVVFTDNPDRGGEPVELAPVTVVPAARGGGSSEARPSSSGPIAAASPGAPFMPYDRFRILSPRHEQAFPVATAGNVAVELGIEPALREEHRVRLLVDGAVSQTAMHTEAFMLANMPPGEHVLQAELLDGSGEVRHRSSPVTIHLQRAGMHRRPAD